MSQFAMGTIYESEQTINVRLTEEGFQILLPTIARMLSEYVDKFSDFLSTNYRSPRAMRLCISTCCFTMRIAGDEKHKTNVLSEIPRIERVLKRMHDLLAMRDYLSTSEFGDDISSKFAPTSTMRLIDESREMQGYQMCDAISGEQVIIIAPKDADIDSCADTLSDLLERDGVAGCVDIGVCGLSAIYKTESFTVIIAPELAEFNWGFMKECWSSARDFEAGDTLLYVEESIYCNADEDYIEGGEL